MRILALLTDAFGAPGGIAQYNQDLLRALATQALVDSIRVLPRNGVPDQAPDNIEQLKSVQGKLQFAAKALVEAMKYRPDLLFCGHLNYLPLAWTFSKLTGAPIWLQLHGIDAWERPEGATARLAEKVQFVTCVSRYTRSKFLSWANIAPTRVKILPNTVHAYPNSTQVSSLRESLDIKANKTLLTVGRLSASERYKGQDRIIACLPQLLKQEPNLSYLIAGDGDDRGRLEQLAEQHGVAGNVKFLGKVPDEQLNSLYAATDLFAMPSTGEGFGIVFLEAMAAGTPALGLDCDGSLDPLQDGDLGIVATEETLCEVLRNALNTPVPLDLADRVQAIFGKQQFQSHVRRLLQTELLQAKI